MSCLNNCNYKSTIEYYDTSVQAITATPSPLNLVGTKVTSTGVSLNGAGSAITVNKSGTYQLHAGVTVLATTAGVMTAQMRINGVLLPETLRAVTTPVGSTRIDLDTVRFLQVGCASTPNVQVVISTDGTAVGTVTLVDGYAVKLA